MSNTSGRIARQVAVYGKGVGCISANRPVMITLQSEDDSEKLHDWFLTQGQAVELIKELERINFMNEFGDEPGVKAV